MFAQRWSTFSLFSLSAMIGLIAFFGGRHFNPPLAENHTTTEVVQAPPKPAVATVAPVEYHQTSWGELSARPATPVRDRDMEAFIEQLAAHDPKAALAFASAQNNLRTRATLLRAALKGWGTTDPQAAIDWSETQTIMDHAQAINALLQGAVQSPDRAVSVTEALIKNHPERAGEYGSDLVSALSEAGQFNQAANFAVASEKSRDDLMLVAYSRWGEFQPQDAINSATKIIDADSREAAMNAIMLGWSPTDPQAALDFAQKNLPREQQNAAMSSALQFWAGDDPAAAATWINQNHPGEASDGGIAQIALSNQLTGEPEVAASWAESIFNPELRHDTFNSLIEKWSSLDWSGVTRYLEQSPTLPEDDRLAYQAKLKSLTFDP